MTVIRQDYGVLQDGDSIRASHMAFALAGLFDGAGITQVHPSIAAYALEDVPDTLYVTDVAAPGAVAVEWEEALYVGLRTKVPVRLINNFNLL